MVQTLNEKPASKNNVRQIKRLVLFDFDGTITTKDTLAEFIRFYHGNLLYFSGLLVLSPILLCYLLKLMPNWKSKQYFLTWFLKGESIEKLKIKCDQFAKTKLPSMIRPRALEAIEGYKKTNSTIVVVSASAEDWVKPWCDANNIICLATRLEKHQDIVTGKFRGKNCHGAEKVCRVNEQFTLADFDQVIAYGDSSGDREMLAVAHQQHYKPFRP
jgi:phosphatidylglycerophosphatase C